MKSLKIVAIHAVAWSVFIGYEVFGVSAVTDVSHSICSYLLHYGINVLLFYAFAHYLFRYVLKWPLTKTAVWTLPVILILGCFYCGLSYIAHLLIAHSTPELFSKQGISPFIIATIWRGIYFILYSTGYFFALWGARKAIFAAQLERDNAILELNCLKAQLNPHLLYSSLNAVYRKVYQVNEEAAKPLHTLGTVIRYRLTPGCHDSLVSLQDEIVQVQRIITLNRECDLPVYFNFVYPQYTDQVRIMPFILPCIAENIFKHGDVSDPQRPAIIRVEINNHQIQISSKNLINKDPIVEGLGSGLNNLKQRLQYTYPNRATLKYCDNGAYFEIEIVIEY